MTEGFISRLLNDAHWVEHSEIALGIPVVILTRSAAGDDILRSYELHANLLCHQTRRLEGFLRVAASTASGCPSFNYRPGQRRRLQAELI
jgi:hypothetical protein